MKKLIILLLFIPALTFGQTSNIRHTISGSTVIHSRGGTPIGVDLTGIEGGADTTLHLDASYGIYKNVGTDDREYYVYDVDKDGDLDELEAAIVARRTIKGTIYVASGTYNLTNEININQSDAALTVIGGPTSLVVPHGYTGNAIDINPTAGLTGVTFEGVSFNEAVSGGLYDRLWTCINVELSTGAYFQMSRFRLMSISHVGDAIHVTLDGNGWMNANNFDEVQGSDFVRWLKVDRSTGDEGSYFDGNIFRDNHLQATANTIVGVDTLYGKHNLFEGVYMWDFNAGQYGYIFESRAAYNIVIGGSIGSKWIDKGNYPGDNYILTEKVTEGNSNVRQNWLYVTSNATINGTATIDTVNLDNVVYSVHNTGNIVAETGITTAMLSGLMYYNGASAIDITANPQIADGVDAQIIIIMGLNDTNTLTLDDADGLRLSAQMVLGKGDTITLIYNATVGDWCEVSRSAN